MVMILSPPRNIFVRRTIQTLGEFLARFLNTNNQPRLSQKKILKNHAAQTFVTVATGVFERSLQAQPSSIYNYVTANTYEYSSLPVPQTKK